MVRNIINVNGSDHSRLRSLVNPALSPRAAERYRPLMREILADLGRRRAPAASFDFVAEIAKPYPRARSRAVMGAPEEDAPRLHDWSMWIQRQFDPIALADPEQLATIQRKTAEFYDWVRPLIAHRRGTPGDDLISSLILAEEEGDRLSDVELENLVLNILVGGVDTTQSQLAHAIRLLAERPGAVGGAARRSRRPGAARRRGGAALRADHAADRARDGRADRGQRRDVPRGLGRRGLRVHRQPRRGRTARRRSSTSASRARPSGCSRSAPASTTASARTSRAPSWARRSRSSPVTSSASSSPASRSCRRVSGIYGVDALPVRVT